MNIKKMFLINTIILLVFASTIILMNNGINLTGSTIAEIYDSEIIYTLNAISGEKTTFVIPIENTLKENITNLYATIEIYNKQNKKIANITTNKIEIKKGEKNELRAEWENKEIPGDYFAKITIYSDTTSAQFLKNFELKEKTITIQNIFIQNIKLGEKTELEILVENNLPFKLKNIKASILIYNQDKTTLANLKSNKKDLNASSLETLKINWDTKGIEPGIYNAKIIVSNKEYSTEKDLVFYIDENNIKIKGVGFAIKYKQEKEINTTLIVSVLIIILIISNILWFIITRRNKKLK